MDKNLSEKKLLKVLEIAQRSKDVPEADNNFQVATMRRIRAIGPLPENGNSRIRQERFFRYFTPVAATLILILVLCLYTIDFIPETEIATLYLNDPVQYAFIETLGL